MEVEVGFLRGLLQCCGNGGALVAVESTLLSYMYRAKASLAIFI